MSERIKELLAKSGVELKTRRPYFDEDPDGYLESDNDFVQNNHDAILWLIEGGGLEKFAELIINQCAEFVEQDQGSGDYLAKRLKNHFGVE